MQTLATWPGPGWAQEDLDILDSLVNKINAGVLLFSSPGRRDGRKEGKNERRKEAVVSDGRPTNRPTDGCSSKTSVPVNYRHGAWP